MSKEKTRARAIEILENRKAHYYGLMPEWVWDMAINSLKIDEMYDLEKENADEFISRSVIEDIKAEIEQAKREGFQRNRKTYDECLSIIQKHISGKE